MSVQEIALAFPRGTHQEVLLEGVLRYAADHDCNWSYITTPESLSLSVLDLAGWPGDGILASINTPEEADFAATLSIPVVNVSSAMAESPVPRSIVDNNAIGVLAAEHLLSKAFPHYAFYGLSGVEYSRRRQQGFTEKLAEAGRASENMYLSMPTFGLRGNSWLNQHRALAEWLASLATPCGLFAVSDYRARQALDACRSINLKVPEQIAVIGVDNEQIICEHAYPRLSSVARNDQMEGYRAAELLHRLLRGEAAAGETQIIAPLQVVERESTATFAAADPRLCKAMTFLHEHLTRPISIDEVTGHAKVSRRWLEYAFREVVGETPYQYLRRLRLERAKRMLADEPSTKIYEVAQNNGFSSSKQLTLAFQQEFGLSPREYRQSLQGKNGA